MPRETFTNEKPVRTQLDKVYAKRTTTSVASPTADVNSLKAQVDALRAVLTASGITAP